MRPWLWALLCLLILHRPAAAQPEEDWLSICQLPRWVSTGQGRADQARTARALTAWVNERNIDMLRIEREKRQVSAAEATVLLNVQKPDHVSDTQWKGTFFAAIAYPGTERRLPPADGAGVLLAYVEPPVPEGRTTPLRVSFSPPPTIWRTSWQLALAACIQPEELQPPTAAPSVFGLTQVTVSSYWLSVAAGLGSVAILYLMLGMAAWRVHARQLRLAAETFGREGRVAPAWLRALNPMVISQDAFGTASLSRFQVLLFTLAAVGVYAYVLLRTEELSSLSTDVLWLLGITLAGSTLASIAEGPVVNAANRLWLLSTGVLDNRPRFPGWHDLLGSEGEIDVTRVQALAFSVFAAAALVANGPSDLERFTVPDTLKYLIGISQAVYVAGKALPRDAARRLNEEVRLLREAEQATLARPDDPEPRLAFDRARIGLQTSLLDVFGERFNAARLRELQPGARVEAPPPPPAEPFAAGFSPAGAARYRGAG